jgi:hypothetical protein
MQNLDDISKVLAYQRSNLLSIQDLYDTLWFDLSCYLAQEQRIREEIPELIKDLVELTEVIESGGTPSPNPSHQGRGIDFSSQQGRGTNSSSHQGGKTMSLPPNLPHQGGGTSSPLPWWEGQGEGERKASYKRIDIYHPKNLNVLVDKAEEYLRERGIETDQDPLLQVLNAQEIIDIADAYRRKYGQIGWDRADYVVVTLAGCVGTLMDMLLVKIPGNPKFLSSLPQGYALTTWIREHSHRIQEDYLEPIKRLAEKHGKTPSPSEEYNGDVVKKESSKTDSQDSSLFAFIFSVLDILRHTGTYIDNQGNVVLSKRLSGVSDHERTLAFTKLLLRLFSDVFASVGIQPPFGSLLEQEQISWQDVISYLQAHGYNVRQFLIMGIVPATIDLIIKGYWLLKYFDQQEKLEQIKVKLTSMLLLSHTIALSGNLLKTGVIFHINPFMLNWNQILRCFPLMISWINEGIERENMIRAKLDEEWVNIYKEKFC